MPSVEIPSKPLAIPDIGGPHAVAAIEALLEDVYRHIAAQANAINSHDATLDAHDTTLTDHTATLADHEARLVAGGL